MKEESGTRQQLEHELPQAHRRISELEGLASPYTQNEFLLNVLESLSHPFYVVDAKNYRILLANTAARLGALSGAATCYALTHRREEPCGAAEHPCPLEEVKRTGKPVVVEHMHYDKDGHVRPVEIHAYPLLDDRGEVIQMIEYALDITERKQAEEAIESLSRFPGENPSPVFRVSKEGVVLYANEASTSLLSGWGCRVNESLPDFWRAFTWEVFALGASKATEVVHGNRVFSLTFAPVVDLDYVNVYGLDITERKQAEEGLRESEARWRSLTEHSPDHIVTLDRNLNIQFVNYASPGLTVEALIGTPLHTYVAEERQSEIRGIFEHVLKTGETARYETKYGTPEGNTIYYESHAVPRVLGDEVMGLTVSARDITERKQAQEDLRRAHDELEQRVQERTSELARTNEELRVEIIEHRRAEERLQRALRREEAMGRIRDRTIAVEDLSESRGDLGRYCIEELSGLGLPIDAVTLQFPSADPDAFITLFPFARRADVHRRNALSGFPWVKEAWDRGEPVVVSRERLDAVGFGHPETQCILEVPLPGEGSLGVSSRVPDAFDREAIRSVEVAAGLIGEGLQRLDVLEALHKREEALRRSNEELARESNQRKRLSRQLIDLLEQDRRRLAMELHDHIGQVLTSCKVELEMIQDRLEPTPANVGGQVKSVEQKTTQLLKDVKTISYGLRPSALDALGLVASLRGLFQTIETDTGVQVRFFHRDVPEHFDPDKELALYRIAQEALNNVVKHAQVGEVFVNLVKRDENLVLSVEDEGVGFAYADMRDRSEEQGGLGLLIMEERAVQLGGAFTVESASEGGTHLLVEIPL